MMITTNPRGCHPAFGYNFVSVTKGGISDGRVNQYESGVPVWLCMSRDGCEGRGADDPKDPKSALTALGLVRDKGTCPSVRR